MKRLWVSAFVTILLISGLGVFDAPTVSAVSIDLVVDNKVMPSQGTYDYFYNPGIAVLNGTIGSLEKVKSAIDSTVNDPQSATSSAIAAKHIQILQDEKAAYQQAFEAGKSAAKSPAQVQIDALVAGEAKFQQGLGTLTVLDKKNASVNGVIQTHVVQRRNLLIQAQQIERGNITAGSVESDSLVNATAVSTAGESASSIIQKSDAEECGIKNLNLVTCADALFTWLIKNTLLQLGGFLVWLTANMLNYAIQVSVLDFSKWASPSLYPLWVIVRQMVSLFVVFAGLYLGFLYIIGRTEAFGKYIGWLVIFALFVNFSYPFSRALVDVSNIVSLNVYSAAVGSKALTTDFSSAATTLGSDTAGAKIMNRLGLYGLVGSATEVSNKNGSNAGFVNQINSMPGALVAVAFVFYAAYIFFMATAIIAVRTAVLVFLIVASPLLLVDSVIPKLGDAAVKMRKMFFEQLVVAPVFMIMLALTLKFMEVFQTNGILGKTTPGNLTGGGVSSIQTFFSILMMLVMLHIMLKVTKSVAGSAGEYATGFMGKVGGFGLGVATGGAGVLARGTIGRVAAGARDSAWMDKLQKSSVGRGMYGLTNSLAQSTYDVRNVGMVSSGMAKAGLTGGFGMNMQKGLQQGFDARKKSREEEVVKFGSNIRDDETRASYFSKANNGRLVKVDAAAIRDAERSVQEKRKEAILAYEKAKPEERRALLDKAGNDYALREKLRTADMYLAPNLKDPNEPDAMKKKVDALVKIDDSDMAKKLIDNDPFADIQDAYKKDIEKEEEVLETKSREKKMVIDGTEQKITEYEYHRQRLAEKKQKIKDEISTKRKELFDQYQERVGAKPKPFVDFELPEDTVGGTRIDTEHQGGVDTTRYDTKEYQATATQRAANANVPPKPVGAEAPLPAANSANFTGAASAPINDVKIYQDTAGKTTTFNGVRDQSFAKHMEEKRKQRQEALLKATNRNSGHNESAWGGSTTIPAQAPSAPANVSPSGTVATA
jgi:hypothetical protein